MDRAFKYILCEKHDFIITEIMKSCTGTLRHYFLKNPSEDYEAKHLTVKAKWKVDTKYNFAVVRNPYARLVSCYLNKIYLYEDPKLEVGIVHPHLNKETTFEEFVNFVCAIPDKKADSHFRSMNYSIHPNTFLARAETFNKDFTNFREEVGLNIYDVARKNTTYDNPKAKPWKEYYTSELREMVSKRYEKDLDLYKYSFD